MLPFYILPLQQTYCCVCRHTLQTVYSKPLPFRLALACAAHVEAFCAATESNESRGGEKVRVARRTCACSRERLLAYAHVYAYVSVEMGDGVMEDVSECEKDKYASRRAGDQTH